LSHSRNNNCRYNNDSYIKKSKRQRAQMGPRDPDTPLSRKSGEHRRTLIIQSEDPVTSATRRHVITLNPYRLAFYDRSVEPKQF